MPRRKRPRMTGTARANALALPPDTAAIKRGQEAARGTVPVVPYWRHYYDHPSRSLTPDRLGAILDAAERGNPRDWFQLLADIWEKDPTVVAAFETRAHSVLTKAWDVIGIEGAGTESAASKQAAWIREALERLSDYDNNLAGPSASNYLDFTGLMHHLLSASFWGFSAAALDWDPDEWILRSARRYEPRHFLFGDPRQYGKPDFNPWELRVTNQTFEDAVVFGTPIEPYQFIVHYYSKPSLPNRFGLGRTLAYWVMFKNLATRQMLQYGDTFGNPLKVGKYDAAADATHGTDRAVLEDALKNLSGASAAIISKAAEIQFIEPARESLIHDRIFDKCNAEIVKAILGHTSTTEPTPGKLGSEDNATWVQDMRVESDARALEAAINNQIIKPMAIWRDGKCLVRFKIRYEAEEDMNARADRFTKLATLMPLSISDLRTQFDLPEPTADEETTQLHPTAPATDAATPDASAAAPVEEKPILGYHIDAGIVSKNEARAQLGLAPEDSSISDQQQRLAAASSAAAAAIAAGLDSATAWRLAGIEDLLGAPPPAPEEPAGPAPEGDDDDDDPPPTGTDEPAATVISTATRALRRLFANAASPTDRRERALAAGQEMEDAAMTAAADAAAIYATLLDGVDPFADDAEQQIRNNLSAFRSAFETDFRRRQAAIAESALASIGIGPRTSTAQKVNRAIRRIFGDDPPQFNLRDDTAAAFLDYQTFTITQIEGEQITESLVESIKANLARAVDEGLSPKEFATQTLEATGVGSINRWHANLVYRNNLQTAHNAVKLFAFEQNPRALPGWEFIAVVDNETTSECRRLDEKIFAHGDNRYFPPIHHNCRSIGSPIDVTEWKAMGYQPSDVTVAKPAGFENTAVANYTKWVEAARAANPVINSLLMEQS